MEYKEFDTGPYGPISFVDNTSLLFFPVIPSPQGEFISFDVIASGLGNIRRFYLCGIGNTTDQAYPIDRTIAAAPELGFQIDILNATRGTPVASCETSITNPCLPVLRYRDAQPQDLNTGQSTTVGCRLFQSPFIQFGVHPPSSSVIVQILGIIKSGYQGTDTYFDVTSATSGANAGLTTFDTRQWGIMGFEIINTSGVALTACRIKYKASTLSATWRDIAGGASNDYSALTTSARNNSAWQFQRCTGVAPMGGNNPYTLGAGQSAFIQTKIVDAAQIQIQTVPTTSAVQIRGFFKG